MAGMVIRGVSSNADIAPHIISAREAIPLSVRFKDSAKEIGAFACFASAIPVALIVSAYEVFFFLGIIVYLVSMKTRMKYEIETPIYEKDGKKSGKGVMLLGRDRENFTNLFISGSQAKEHFLVMGSTGSGKTRFLLSILYQSMLMGSGCMYIDGKADNTVFWLVFSLCQRLDRIDDFMVINYLTTESSLLKEKNASIRGDKRILTNTLNPYSSGDTEQLRSMTVGLMRDSGGDGDMWKGRASSLLSGVMAFLTYMRSIDRIQMSVASIRDAMPLDKVVRIVNGHFNGSDEVVIGDNRISMSSFKQGDIPEYAIRPLRKYLDDLPGYNEKSIKEDSLDPECYKQHGFLTMQLTEALSDLSETYGHIFNAPMGEVDFSDLIYSRRILFVMLPALQRDPDALANLGKLIIATIRSALGPQLGTEVEGEKHEVLDKKATNAEVPYFIIMDEYGYYSVKGFGVAAAQARSLGISLIFAGQDYPSFENNDSTGAKAIIGNTNTKIAMKLEEKSTTELFIERADKKETPRFRGARRERDPGFMNSRHSRDEIVYEEKSVINANDLYGQGPGQAHIIIGNRVFRTSLFSMLVEGEANGTTHEVAGTRINRALMVRPPRPDDMKGFREERRRIVQFMEGDSRSESGEDIGDRRKALDSKVKRSAQVDNLFRAFRKSIGEHNTGQNSAMLAIAQIAMGKAGNLEAVSTENAGTESQRDKDKARREKSRRAEEFASREGVDHTGMAQRGQSGHASLASESEKVSSMFEGAMDEMLSANGETPMRQRLIEVAEDYTNGDREAAEKDADRSIEVIKEGFKYLNEPKPKRVGESRLMDSLQSTYQHIGRLSSDSSEGRSDRGEESGESGDAESGAAAQSYSDFDEEPDFGNGIFADEDESSEDDDEDNMEFRPPVS